MVLTLCLFAGRLTIEVQGDTQDEIVRAVRIDETPVETSVLPLGIVQYVLRTKSCVLLDDAFHSGTFTFDPHVSKHGTKSVLCLPVLGQNRMVAVLYLENNLMPGFLPLLPLFSYFQLYCALFFHFFPLLPPVSSSPLPYSPIFSFLIRKSQKRGLW